jgi:hypothetical protein
MVALRGEPCGQTFVTSASGARGHTPCMQCQSGIRVSGLPGNDAGTVVFLEE